MFIYTENDTETHKKHSKHQYIIKNTHKQHENTFWKIQFFQTNRKSIFSKSLNSNKSIFRWFSWPAFGGPKLLVYIFSCFSLFDFSFTIRWSISFTHSKDALPRHELCRVPWHESWRWNHRCRSRRRWQRQLQRPGNLWYQEKRTVVDGWCTRRSSDAVVDGCTRRSSSARSIDKLGLGYCWGSFAIQTCHFWIFGLFGKIRNNILMLFASFSQLIAFSVSAVSSGWFFAVGSAIF